MRLSPEADRGVRQLLELMTSQQLVQLARTVTKQLLVPEHRREAIDMIVRFSSSPSQLLRRQKISRKLLAAYVSGLAACGAGENEAVQFAADDGDDEALTKARLIARVLVAWKCRDNNEDNDADSGGSSDADGASLPTMSCDETDDISSQPTTTDFCDRFFARLNADRLGDGGGAAGRRASLFFSDARVRLTLRDGATVVSVAEAVGVEQCVLALSQLPRRHALTLQPNTAPAGMQHATDRFGRHALAVCGTAVHAGQQLAGVFQLLAVLASDGGGAAAAASVKLVACELCVVATPVLSGAPAPSLRECGVDLAMAEQLLQVAVKPLTDS